MLGDAWDTHMCAGHLSHLKATQDATRMLVVSCGVYTFLCVGESDASCIFFLAYLIQGAKHPTNMRSAAAEAGPRAQQKRDIYRVPRSVFCGYK